MIDLRSGRAFVIGIVIGVALWIALTGIGQSAGW